MELRQIQREGFEEIWEGRDLSSHFHGFIALHNTQRGPGLGGVRFWTYPSPREALADVLRLARSMTYKAAVADLSYGGGKAVLIKPSQPFDRNLHMRIFGQMIQFLEGRYIAAKDVGTKEEDMAEIQKHTPWVSGLPAEIGGAGDPSPLTALGVRVGIQAGLEEIFGSSSLKDITVAIQGVGGVGSELARLLSEEGAKLIVSDVNATHLEKLSKKLNLKVVEPAGLYDVEAGIFSPCALGQVIGPETIDRLKVRLLAGAANDQLQDEPRDSQALEHRGILYAPDFVINSGGLIHVALELEGYQEEKAKKKVEQIGPTLREIFEISKNNKITTYVAALRLAESRL